MHYDQRRESLLGARAALLAVACAVALGFAAGCTTDSTAEGGLDTGAAADTAEETGAGTDKGAADGAVDSGDGTGDASSADAANSDGEASTDAASAFDGDAVEGSDLGTADLGSSDGSDAAPLPQCATADDCPAQNPCFIGTCTTKGACAFSPKADASPCDDGNACTTADACSAGQCSGKGQLACDDENPCTADKCNPVAGCLNLPVAASTACDDGDACTQGDSCQQGQCEAGVNTCQCKNNSDCNKFEDGDQCNGTLYCDKTAGAPYTCKVNPASVVSCPSVNNSACQKNTCVPATGQCKLILSPENTPCDDGDSCTTGDFCDTGLCQGGVNTCYCKKDSDCKAFEDGNLCNGSLFCNKATAQCQVNPVTVVTCQTVDDTQCLRNTCNPKEGKCYLLPLKDGKVCDDGNACTPNEACDKGECQSAVNTCECQKDADCLAKDDGNLCNGTLYCDVQAKKCRVNPVTVVTCNTDDDPACLADVCDPKTGKCKEIGLPKDGTACDDGNLCTALSLCSGGQCVGQANVCECQKDSDCAAKEDGNLCNGTLFCNPKSSKCEVNPATVVECASGFDENCLTNQCDPKTGGCGMQPAHQGNQCDDGSVCSAGGWCALGTCEVTVKQACECVQDSDCAKLEDGDLCNGTLYCDKTGSGNSGGKPSCKLNPATVITCPTVDNTACSKAMCQAKTGQCAQTPVSGPCEDGKVCTEKDGCLSGKCVGLAKVCSDGIACTTDACQEPFGCVSLPGPASSCDDQNPCTQDSCDPKSGCTAAANSAPCDDGNTCTTKDVCKGGSCSGGLNTCNDDNPCTDDGCGGGKCQYSNNTADCSDGNSCTEADKCALGKCGGGKPKNCDDGDLCTADSCSAPSGLCLHSTGGSQTCSDANPCTDDLCHPVLGCGHANNKAPCSDGNPCTSGDGCLGGTCASIATVQCDDGNPCTDDSCDPKKSGCTYALNTKPCSDGVGCTKVDACKDGKCQGTVDCNDGNPCTQDSCDFKTGNCTTASLEGGPCDDSDKCTTESICTGGVCKATKPGSCEDGNLCTDDFCDKFTGCKNIANSAPCQVGVCTAGDTCKSGACVAATTARYFDKTLQTSSTSYEGFDGIVALPDSGFVATGRYAPASCGPYGCQMAKKWDSLAVRYDAAGAVKWQTTVDYGSYSAGDAEDWLSHPQLLSNGTVAMVGTKGDNAKLLQLQVLVVQPADGKVVGQHVFEGLGQTAARDDVGRALARAILPVGERLAFAGTQTTGITGMGKEVLVGRLATDGTPDFVARLDEYADQDVSDIQFLANGWVVTVGTTWHTAGPSPGGVLQGKANVAQLGGTDIEVLWWDEKGVIQRLVRLGTTGDDSGRSILPMPDGTLLVGCGLPGVYAGTDSAVISIDATGKVLWTKGLTASAGENEVIAALQLGADGIAVAVGSRFDVGMGKHYSTWYRLDPQGKVLTEVGFPIGNARSMAVARLPDTGWVIAGYYGQYADGQVARVDPWFNFNCSFSGQCWNVPSTKCVDGEYCTVPAGCNYSYGTCVQNSLVGPCVDGDTCTAGEFCTNGKCGGGVTEKCDDGNPCTSDWCDKATGCKTAPYSDGFACASGKSCQAGVCK